MAHVDVFLHGDLGRFGSQHAFNLDSRIEVIRALAANYPGFREHLIEHDEPGYRISVNGAVMTLEELHLNTADGDSIDVFPIIAGGSGGKGVGTIIGGVALVLAGVLTKGLTSGVGFQLLAGAGIAAGLALTATGISGLLTNMPMATEKGGPSPSKGGILNSSTLGPGIDMPGQGMVIPIRFGRQAVEGIPVSVRVVIKNV